MGVFVSIFTRYRFLRYRHVAGLLVAGLLLAGCGGGGGGSNPAPPANPTFTQSSASIGAAGGAVTATFGTQSVTANVPAGALSGPGTVTMTVFANSAAPQALSSKRQTKTIGAGAALIVEFSVTVTGATLLEPLSASASAATPAAGTVVRLAGFGTTVDDVDTVTVASGTATTDPNLAYSRMSLANNTFYAFYSEPSTVASAPPTPVVTVATTATNPLPMQSSATFSASEKEPNGFPFLDATFAFSVDNGSLGTINSSTGILSTGPVDGSGNVVATDTTTGRGNPHGSAAVTVSSQRPGNAGDAFQFTGTLTSTTQLTASPNGVTTLPQTSTATVALTSTVAGFAPAAGGGMNAINSVEVDTYPLQTITTKTASTNVYATSGPSSTVSIGSSNATDSNGVQYINQYGSGNGLLDVLPETAGTFGPNNAALTYTENDPASFGRQRATNADGSYTEQDTDTFGDVQTINGNADFSGTYDSTQFDALSFTLTKPTGTPPTITVTLFSATSGGLVNDGSVTILSWIPTTLTQPSVETDTDNAGVAYPAACQVPAKYGTSGHQLVATINRVDPALGNAEVQTTTTYTAPSVGPVCIQIADTVNTFYDYTGQNNDDAIFVGDLGHPVEITTLAETLTLQSATTSGGAVTSSTLRNSASSTAAPLKPTAFAPVAFARARFDHLVHEQLKAIRKSTFNKSALPKGVKSL
jgi:hypothetical protein